MTHNIINFEKLREKGQSFLTNHAKEILFDVVVKKLEINFYIIDRDGMRIEANDNLVKTLSLENHFLRKLNMQHEGGLEEKNASEIDSFLRQQIFSKPVWEMSAKQAWENSQKVMNSGKTMTFEEVQTTTDNKTIYYHSIKTPIFDDDNGEVIGLVGISIDITERKRYEEELKQAQLTIKNLKAQLTHTQDEILEDKVAYKVALKHACETYHQLKLENETLRFKLNCPELV